MVYKYALFLSNFKHLKYNSLLFLFFLEAVRLDLMFHLDATSNFLNDKHFCTCNIGLTCTSAPH